MDSGEGDLLENPAVGIFASTDALDETSETNSHVVVKSKPLSGDPTTAEILVDTLASGMGRAVPSIFK
jgi:hypothetical protein